MAFNYKQQATANEILSAVSNRLGASFAPFNVTSDANGNPGFSFGAMVAGDVSGSVTIWDQEGGYPNPTGFQDIVGRTGGQPIYTTGIAAILLEGSGSVGTAPVEATGTFTVGTVVATNFVTIVGNNLTAVASGATSVQFNVGGSPSATAVNIAAAINANPTYSQYVTAYILAASPTVVRLRASVPGAIGNLITISSNSANITASGANLTGGAGASPTALQISMDTLLDLIGECAKRGLRTQIYLTNAGVPPVPGTALAGATLVADFFPNQFFGMLGLV